MKKFILPILTVIVITLSSCRTEFETVASTGNLEFSKSKVFLDTVFNNIGSSTYGLKVYNRSSEDIKIPVIKLGNGLNSRYRMMVDGMTGNQGKIFDNVEILAKDSLFIFIEITNPDPNPVQLQFTYDDQILFDVGSNQQKVDLTTLIWDAKFIFPNRPLPTDLKEKLSINGNATDIIGHRLTDNDFSPVGSWHINNYKPTVIYGYALIPDGKTLTISEGASLYFHSDTNSGLIVENGGKLVIDGEQNIVNSTTEAIITKREVTFEADRLEPFFEDTPGQWGGIFIISNGGVDASKTNKIKYLTLKNSIFGVYTQNTNNAGSVPNLEINNSQIYNSSAFGMLNRNTTVVGKNVVINYCGQSCFAGVLGGNYDFTHCTFNNDWSSSSKSNAVLITDYQDDLTNNTRFVANVNANFKNCIVYTRNNIGIILENKGGSSTTFSRNFNNCLFKFKDENTTIAGLPLYNFINGTTNTFGNIKNLDPKFKNAAKNKLNILIGSPAINSGLNLSPNFNDILNVPRPTAPNTNPDIGAYQFVP